MSVRPLFRVIWVGREDTYSERLEHVLGVGVDLEGAGLREVEGRDLGDVLVLALALLLLKLE